MRSHSLNDRFAFLLILYVARIILFFYMVFSGGE